MKNKKKIALVCMSAFLAAGCLFGTTACGGSASNSGSSYSSFENSEQEGMYFEVTNYEITLSESITLPLVGGGSGVIWSSSEESIATVDAAGKVTPVSIGETIIKAKKDNESAICRVVVIAARAESVLTLTLNKTSLSLYEGDTFALTAELRKGSEYLNEAVAFESLNEEVASVSADGIVTAKAAGLAQIKVSASNNGQSVEEILSVNVKEKAEQLLINVNSFYLIKDEENVLSASVVKGQSVLQEALTNVTYTVNDSSIAEIVDGKLIGKTLGYVTLSATCEYEGKTLSSSIDLRVRDVFKVQYISQGETIETISVFDGEVVPQIEKPVVKEQRFLYWQYMGEEYDFSTLVYEDIDLVAKWNPFDFSQSFYGATMTDFEGKEGGEVLSASREIGGLRYVCSAKEVYYTIYLPRIDFTKYAVVEFSWSVNGWTQFGQGSDLYFYDGGDMMEGLISFERNDNGTVTMTMSKGRSAHSKTITDPEVINGSKSYTLSIYTFIAGRDFEMGPINCYETLEDVPPPPPVPPIEASTDTYIRDIHGDAYDAVASDGAYTYTVQEWHATDAEFAAITLPKIDFTENTQVTFEWYVSGWTQFGCKKELWFYGAGNAMYGTATITYVDGALQITMQKTGGSAYGLTVTDADVISGEKSFELSFRAYAQQYVTLSNFKFGVENVPDNPTEEPEIPDSSSEEPEIPDSSSAEHEQVEITFEGTGVYNEKGEKVSDSLIDGNVVTYYTYDTNGNTVSMTLPIVNYLANTKVTFDYSVSGWTHFGQGTDLWYYEAGDVMNGTVTIENTDNRSLKITMTLLKGHKSYSRVINDPSVVNDILNGKTALCLNFISYAPQTIVISNFTVA